MERITIADGILGEAHTETTKLRGGMTYPCIRLFTEDGRVIGDIFANPRTGLWQAQAGPFIDPTGHKHQRDAAFTCVLLAMEAGR